MLRGSLAALAVAALCVMPQIAAATDITPTEHPYDETQDAHATIANALTQAKAEHKRVLLDFGGNWCLDCKILAAVMEKPDVKPVLDKSYIQVSVDIGRYTKNMDILKSYGVTARGAPTVLVLDADGKLLNATDAQELTDARSMTAEGIADYLKRWVVTPGS